jgi:hypothetical protein
MACALVLPLAGHAQDATREQQLEQRVAQLEQQLNELKSLVQAQAAQTRAPAAVPAKTVAAAPAAHEVVLTTPGNAYANTKVKIGGFIKTDFMSTHTDGYLGDQNAARDLYLPGATPIGGKSASYSDMHAKFSRIGVGVDSLTDGGDKVGAFLEWDFFGNSLGNENASNGYGLTLRHAYLYWNNWLAGQTWTNFMDPNALPEAVDFIGVTDGTVFVRQAQLRYTSGGFAVALENPHTTVTPYQGGSAQLSPDHNVMPDLTARYTWKGDWGFFGVAGLLRQLRTDGRNDALPSGTSTATAGGVSVMGKAVLGSNDDLRYSATVGKGIGRYLAFGLGSDVVVDANGELNALDGYGGFVAWRHVFSPKVRTNLMYSAAMFDNDKAITGFGVTERAQSLHANLIYSPFPKLDIGAELIFGQRALEDDREGDLRRIHTSVKYSF